MALLVEVAALAAIFVRLLAQHPVVELHRIAFRGDAGRVVADIFPGVRGSVGHRFEDLFNADQKGCDAVFFAEPNGIALQQAPVRLSSACRIALPCRQGRGAILSSSCR